MTPQGEPESTTDKAAVEEKRAGRRLGFVLAADGMAVTAAAVARLAYGEPLPGAPELHVLAAIALLGFTLAIWNRRIVAENRTQRLRELADLEERLKTQPAAPALANEHAMERICATLADIQEAVERRIECVTAEHDHQVFMSGYTAGMTARN